MEKIYPSLSDLFTEYLDEVEPSQRNMEASAIQRMNDDRERSVQRIIELEGSLGLFSVIFKLCILHCKYIHSTFVYPTVYLRAKVGDPDVIDR